MTNKYGVLVSFPQNLYTGPLCVTDPECGLYDQQIWSFGQFLPQIGVFGKSEG
jgi:hypothetical protein